MPGQGNCRAFHLLLAALTASRRITHSPVFPPILPLKDRKGIFFNFARTDSFVRDDSRRQQGHRRVIERDDSTADKQALVDRLGETGMSTP